MKDNGERQGGRRKGGPLTGITAFRVEAQVEQLVAEAISWTERLQDPDPSPVAAFSGRLCDFDDDPERGRGKTVYALRVIDKDEAQVEQVRRQVEDALRNNGIAISAAAGHTFRIHARTVHEAGRSHRVVLLRLEVLQFMRLSPDSPREVPVMTWLTEHVNWDEIAALCWPTLYVGLLLDLFLNEFYRQKSNS